MKVMALKLRFISQQRIHGGNMWLSMEVMVVNLADFSTHAL